MISSSSSSSSSSRPRSANYSDRCHFIIIVTIIIWVFTTEWSYYCTLTATTCTFLLYFYCSSGLSVHAYPILQSSSFHRIKSTLQYHEVQHHQSLNDLHHNLHYVVLTSQCICTADEQQEEGSQRRYRPPHCWVITRRNVRTHATTRTRYWHNKLMTFSIVEIKEREYC